MNVSGITHTAVVRRLVVLSLSLTVLACGGTTDQVGDDTFTATSADEAYQNGVLAQREGRLQEAEAQFRSAIATNPRFLAAHVQLGKVLLERDRAAEALQSFDRAIEIRDRSGEAWSGRAAALLELGRIDEAAVAAEAAMDRGFLTENSFVLALTFEQAGEPDRAIALLESVLRDTPERADIRIELARLYVQNGRARDAVPTLERGARRDERDGRLWRELAALFYSLETWDRSIEAWQHVVALDENDPYSWTRLGEAHLRTGNVPLATEAFDNALEADPRWTEAYILRGQGEYERGFVDRALDDANSALSIDDSSLRALLLKGHALERLDREREALQAYVLAVTHHPQALEPAMSAAELYLRDGNPTEAINLLERHEQETSPEFIELLLNAYVATGEGDRVLTRLLQLSEVDPDDHVRLLSLVQVALTTPGQTVLTSGEVVEYAERAFSLSGGYRLEYNLALIDALAADGQRARARRQARQALEDLPGSPELQERVRSLR